MSLLDPGSGSSLTDSAGCQVVVSNREIVGLYPALASVTINLTRSKAGIAKLQFSSRRDEKGQWEVQDSGVFQTWVDVKVSALFATGPVVLFRGYVREVTAQY